MTKRKAIDQFSKTDPPRHRVRFLRPGDTIRVVGRRGFHACRAVVIETLPGPQPSVLVQARPKDRRPGGPSPHPAPPRTVRLRLVEGEFDCLDELCPDEELRALAAALEEWGEYAERQRLQRE